MYLPRCKNLFKVSKINLEYINFQKVGPKKIGGIYFGRSILGKLLTIFIFRPFLAKMLAFWRNFDQNFGILGIDFVPNFVTPKFLEVNVSML